MTTAPEWFQGTTANRRAEGPIGAGDRLVPDVPIHAIDHSGTSACRLTGLVPVKDEPGDGPTPWGRGMGKCLDCRLVLGNMNPAYDESLG